MQLPLLFVAAPAAHALVSYMAAVPESLMTLADSGECTLPDDFQIQQFSAQSPDGQTADSLDFTFNDDSTILNTACRLNASSVPVSDDGRTARYSCDNPLVQFIWQNETITVIEKVCPGNDGAADYEASGTASVPLVCDGDAGNGTSNGGGVQSRRRTKRATACKSNSDDIRSRFFSIQPVPSG